MKCPNCNGEIKLGEKYCGRCGNPVPDEKSGKDEKKTGKKNAKQNRSSGKKEKSGKNGKKGLFLPLGLGILCVLIIVVVGLVVTPKQTTAGKLQEKMDLGNNYLEKADYVKAKAAFSEALEIDEKSPEAALGMADAYNGQKKPDQALKYLKKASQNVKTASEEKDATHVPKDTADFSSHYEKSCNETADQYKSSNNISKQQETKEVIKEFKTIVIYVPEKNPSTDTPVPAKKETKKTSKQMAKQKTKEKVTPEETKDSEDPLGPTEKKADDAGKAVVTTEPEEEPTVTPESPTPTPEEAIAVPEDEVTPTPTEVMPTPTEITPTPTVLTPTPTPKEEFGIPVAEEEYVYDPATDTGTYVPVGEDTGDSGQTVNKPDTSANTSIGEIPTTETPVAEVPAAETPAQEEAKEDSAEGENADEKNADGEMVETEVTVEEDGEESTAEAVDEKEILDDYSDTILEKTPRVDLNGKDIPYTYGDVSAVNAALNGVFGMQRSDLDKDGKPELLVIAMQNGKMTFTVYRVVDGEVKADATVNATDGIGTALPEADYGFTQECFGKEDDAGWTVGFASYVYGTDAGDGTPTTKFSIEAYKLHADGTTIQLTEEDAASLVGIDLTGDLSTVFDPLSDGLATTENGLQDLVSIVGNLSAGSENLGINVKDYTVFEQ